MEGNGGEKEEEEEEVTKGGGGVRRGVQGGDVRRVHCELNVDVINVFILET